MVKASKAIPATYPISSLTSPYFWPTWLCSTPSSMSDFLYSFIHLPLNHYLLSWSPYYKRILKESHHIFLSVSLTCNLHSHPTSITFCYPPNLCQLLVRTNLIFNLFLVPPTIKNGHWSFTKSPKDMALLVTIHTKSHYLRFNSHWNAWVLQKLPPTLIKLSAAILN